MSMNFNPGTELISEDELRAALRPHKVDADSFEAGVRKRIQDAETEQANDPLANAPQLLRVAAAILPLPIITGGKVTGSAATLANASGLYKLLGYLAMPAICLFVLPAAAIFGAVKIRSVQRGNVPDSGDPRALQEAAGLWWRRHKWLAIFFYAITFALAWLGATSLMLLLYLISLGVMLYVLSAFAKLGLGNRRLIGQWCIPGLVFLAMVSQFCTIGAQDIHFVDQILLTAIFLSGVGVLIPVVTRGDRNRVRRYLAVVYPLALVPFIAWLTDSTWRPITPARIKAHVESFDRAPFSSSSWRQWEIVASWAIESGLDPDLSSARQLLAEELSSEQTRVVLPFILTSASRVGLVQIDQIDQLSDDMRGYKSMRHSLLHDPYGILVKSPITSLGQYDWVIRASVLRNDMTLEERNLLEKRLHVTLEKMWTNPYRQLEEALRVTQLLEIIGRPIDRDRYRSQVHGMLRELHATDCGLFQASGGFKTFLNSYAGDLEVTAYAVELMQIYGVPDGIDPNWIRSFLRPRSIELGDPVYAYMRAAVLARLNSIPGVRQPTWLDYLYYERSMVMGVVLVLLCIYATLSSPLPTKTPTQ